MKKTLSIILLLVMCLSLCACGGSPDSNKTTEPDIIEQIQQTTSLKELDSFQLASYDDEDYKQAVIEKWKEIFAQTINGYYYNEEVYIEHIDIVKQELDPRQVGIPIIGKNYKLGDYRAVYMVSENEIYFMPYSEYDITENIKLTLEDISGMEDSEMYCYRVLSYGDGSDFSVELVNNYFENTDAIDLFKTLKLTWDIEDESVLIEGNFADENVNEDEYDKAKIPGKRLYYNSEETAGLKADEREEQIRAEQKNEDSLKNSIPKPGMTAEQVRITKWGYPDKVNKDTYGDRVEEQWVYDNEGYVYLTNGVVTSVSER